MTPKTSLARIVLAASAVCAPLVAQTPLFTDGPAFGGSKVFSEGANPLGNPARYGQAQGGYYFTFLNGDQESKNTESILNNTGPADRGVPGAAGQRPLGPAHPGLRLRRPQERRQPRPDPGGVQFDPRLSGPERSQPGHRDRQQPVMAGRPPGHGGPPEHGHAAGPWRRAPPPPWASACGWSAGPWARRSSPTFPSIPSPPPPPPCWGPPPPAWTPGTRGWTRAPCWN